nr:pollen-specific leucine-rich repeat extensin-like protein 1 [Ipomoea batatas]
MNLQFHLDRPEASSSRAPPPCFQMAPPLNLQLHLDQPEASSSGAPPPCFDTVLRLSVTPHAPRTEQGFKEDAPPLANLHLHKDFINKALKRNVITQPPLFFFTGLPCHDRRRKRHGDLCFPLHLQNMLRCEANCWKILKG